MPAPAAAPALARHCRRLLPRLHIRHAQVLASPPADSAVLAKYRAQLDAKLQR